MAPAASTDKPYKRHIEAVQRVYDCAKRTKTQHDSDSTTSTLSDESALMPTSLPEDSTEASELESEAESEVSESSEEPSDESDEEEESEDEDDEEDAEQASDAVVNLRANRGKKPAYKLPDDESLEDIRPFLKDFLPRLEAANQELEVQKKAGTLQSSEITGDEDGHGEEQYIELHLGLGVLEERGDDADAGAAEPSDNERDANTEEQEGKEKDILGKLMGRAKVEEPVGIQDVTHG